MSPSCMKRSLNHVGLLSLAITVQLAKFVRAQSTSAHSVSYVIISFFFRSKCTCINNEPEGSCNDSDDSSENAIMNPLEE